MPRRAPDSTKFTSGNVFIIGGSRGLTGAPSLAALAAMRAGAGYVTVGAPASLELIFTVRLLEAMMVGPARRRRRAHAGRRRGGRSSAPSAPTRSCSARGSAAADGAQALARALSPSASTSRW